MQCIYLAKCSSLENIEWLFSVLYCLLQYWPIFTCFRWGLLGFDIPLLGHLYVGLCWKRWPDWFPHGWWETTHQHCWMALLVHSHGLLVICSLGSCNCAAVWKWYVCGTLGLWVCVPMNECMHLLCSQCVFLAEMCVFVTDLLLLSPEWMLGTSALLFSLFITLCMLFCLSRAVDLMSGA